MSSLSSSDTSANYRSGTGRRPDRPSRPPGPTIDRKRVELATRELLLALGEDPDRPGLQETPRRIAESWGDFYSGGHAAIRPLPDHTQSGDGVVFIRNIDFVSVCEHHLLPFSGLVHVAYQPRDVLLGLSDIPRLVRRASSRLQLQEGLTHQIADQLREETDAHGVLIVVEGRHGCVSDRGIRQARVRAVTTAASGTLGSPSDRISLMSVLTNGSVTAAPEAEDDSSAHWQPS
ncbi:GTP cyclohydrolase I [Microbacterium sp. HD4P20]|uniref:GTP cyclohydrolase I n=1 Tax=Microbacterium sp. HD4P20 TaxID=2864874 RepID=UPI001C6416BA